MAKKNPDLSGLVATKGATAPTRLPTRSAVEANSEPLNFRVTKAFRRRFRTYAAAHDMRLNELLYQAFEALEKSHG